MRTTIALALALLFAACGPAPLAADASPEQVCDRWLACQEATGALVWGADDPERWREIYGEGGECWARAAEDDRVDCRAECSAALYVVGLDHPEEPWCEGGVRPREQHPACARVEACLSARGSESQTWRTQYGHEGTCWSDPYPCDHRCESEAVHLAEANPGIPECQ